MADFEKVRTGHEHWTTKWPAVSALDDVGTGQSRAGLGRGP